MINLSIKRFTIALILSISAFCAIADDNINSFGSDLNISDLALIYAGSSRRPVWTKEQLQPYVTHIYADGSEDWFFDGFLFLEFNNGRVQFENGGGLEPATQSDWLWLLDQFFAPDKKLDALDKLISEKKQSLGEPPLRHKVVISCCAPSKNKSGVWSNKNPWGKIDDKYIFFNSSDGRISAVKWYIDTMLEKWNAAGFENLDLEGIYWIEESLFSNGDIMAEVNDYVHSKGLRSYWIPYYIGNQQHWSNWKKKYNFDMCYIQPNYAFYKDNGTLHLKSLLDATVDAARGCGAGLEFEFETQNASNALHSVNPTLHRHIHDYMDVYDSRGVFDSAGVAYYSGTQGFIHMNESSDPVDHATIDRLARYVAKRQKARVDAAKIKKLESDSIKSPLAHSLEGRIILAPDTCCHDLSGRLLYVGAGDYACESGIYIVSDNKGRSMKLVVK